MCSYSSGTLFQKEWFGEIAAIIFNLSAAPNPLVGTPAFLHPPPPSTTRTYVYRDKNTLTNIMYLLDIGQCSEQNTTD